MLNLWLSEEGLFSLLADLTLLLHFLFILFVIFGGILVYFYRGLIWLHLPCVFWASIINATPWMCPLTPLENYFRSAVQQETYRQGFIDHYIGALVYPEGLNTTFGIVLGLLAASWNGFVYYMIWRSRDKSNHR